MPTETYRDHMQSKFGEFQDDWDTLARDQAEALSQTLTLQNGAMFSRNDAQKIKSACAKLIIAIEQIV